MVAMRDITSPKKKTIAKAFLLPDNPERRNLLKIATLGGMVLFLNIITKKADEFFPSFSSSASTPKALASSKKTLFSNNFNFTENKKEATVFDADGEAILIFEKEA